MVRWFCGSLTVQQSKGQRPLPALAYLDLVIEVSSQNQQLFQ
jgi:hypothetical protein